MEPLALRIRSSTEWLGNAMNGRARLWASKPEPNRDLMLVLHRPIEPTTQSGHWLLAKLLSTLDTPPACIMECESLVATSVSHISV